MEADDPRITYIDLETATTPPSGIINHVKDHWWCYRPSHGLIFYRARPRDPLSPQCNPNEGVSRRLCDSIYKFAETRFVPSVFIRVNPRDYVD